MNDDPYTSPNHLDDLLAAYVEGSASVQERTAVERHLATCGECRAEVAFARSGRAALMALPELDAPGLAAEWAKPAGAVLGTGSDRAAAPPLPRIRRRTRAEWWPRVAWGSGLAAAAALAAVFIFFGGTGRPSLGPGAKIRAIPAQAAPPAAGPTLLQQRTDYSPQSLAALASGLANESKSEDFGSSSGSFAPAPSPTPGQHLLAAAARDAVGCLRTGGGIDAGTPTYLASARFQGTPAYVGAFLVRPAGGSYLAVVAVTRNGCRLLGFIHQRL